MREIQYQPVQFLKDRNVISYYSYAGGIFDTENSDRLNDNEVANMFNFDIVGDGSLASRAHFVKSELSPQTVETDKSYADVVEFDRGTAYEIIGILNNKVVKIPSNEVLVDNFGPSMNAVQYGTRLYLLGNGHLMVYDGTKIEEIEVYHKAEIDKLTDEEKARNDLDFIKNGKFLTISMGRLIISGIDTEPNSVYFSNANMPWFFDSKDLGDVLYPTQADNDRVTALEDYADGVIVFKRESIYMLASDTSNMYRMNVPTGTMSPKTIKRVDNFLVFLGTDKKVYGIYGGSYYSMNKDRVFIYSLSENVNSILSKIKDTDREKVVATFYNGIYMLAYPIINNGKEITETLNLYVLGRTSQEIIDSQAWGRYNHVDIKGFINIPGQSLNMYSRNSTRIYKFDKSSIIDYDIYGNNPKENTEQYTLYIKFKEFNMEIPEHYKIFRAGWIQFNKIHRTDIKEFKHNVYIDKRKIYLAYNEDQRENQFYPPEDKWSSDGNDILWDDFYWVGNENAAYYFRINAKGRTIQNEIELVPYNTDVKILGTSFELKVKYPQRNNMNNRFKRGN